MKGYMHYTNVNPIFYEDFNFLKVMKQLNAEFLIIIAHVRASGDSKLIGITHTHPYLEFYPRLLTLNERMKL